MLQKEWTLMMLKSNKSQADCNKNIGLHNKIYIKNIKNSCRLFGNYFYFKINSQNIYYGEYNDK